MLLFREHRTAFLVFKVIQIFFTVIVLAIELGQYAVFSNIKPNSPDFVNANLLMNGATKIWDYTVFSLVLVALGVYVYNFKGIWSKGPYFSIDLTLAVLWFTTAITILDPAYGNHPLQTCSTAQTSSLTTICNTWLTSVIFCWLNMLAFTVSTLISWRVRQEKRQGIYSKPTVKPEVKKRLSQRQSVLLKQGLENPDKSQPVMLESGIKPLMLVQLSNT